MPVGPSTLLTMPTRLPWSSCGRPLQQQLAELDLSFEEITQHPQACLQQLAQRLGLAGRVDCGAVQAELASLPVPERWMDPGGGWWLGVGGPWGTGPLSCWV